MEASILPVPAVHSLHVVGSQSEAMVASEKRHLVNHSYNLSTKKGLPWATLNIQSRSRTTSRIPFFIEGEPITGSIELNLLEEKSMKSVSIAVRSVVRPRNFGTMVDATPHYKVVGELICDTYNRFVFIEVGDVVWSAPPKGELIAIPGGGSQIGLTFKGKLSGQFHLPFSVLLPWSVELPDNTGRLKHYPLPCMSAMRLSCATISYRIFAKVEHGSFMKPDSM